jgi:hypothetical protein
MDPWIRYTNLGLPLRPETFTAGAPFGWTVTRCGVSLVIYKRDCPEWLDHVPVFRTRADARKHADLRL